MGAVAPLVLKFEAFPERNLTVILFKDVTNAGEIHAKLLDRSLEPELALINPSKVQSVFALHLAAHKSVAAHEREALATHTLHSEVVFNLSGLKHITEGLKRFGMAEDASEVLVCRFDATDEDIAATRALVKGIEVDIETALEGLRDQDAIKKNYKTGDLECQAGVGTIEDAVLARIATAPMR
uniref:EKC/KEOPS complex subunit CGI121 n=1 Tax=Micromonas pusilla TaxID=38833 RepID=A0A7S0NNC2_MICPS|mmetsp:Transcript_5702/g.25355  ORF Transcript_5702/g.25355 Transcript_5702/m.25355 type:complete len:183 (-) Transcript_5702:799-1347(-)